MKTYYVYELVNQKGKIEYIGCSYRPKSRFNQHTRSKPIGSGCGKFYGRTDISMNIVKSFTDKKEARLYEGELKLKHNLKWTEKNSILRNKKCSELGKVSGSLYGRENGIRACAQPIRMYKDNKFIGEYFSISEAARQLNLHKGKLSNVVRGLYKQHKGYKVQYA